MSALVRFETEDGAALLVEVDDDAFGVEQVARGDNGVIAAGQKLEEVIATAQATIRAVVEGLRRLAPDEHEIEFGLKLNAEAGVLVAKTAMEGHFTVKLAWRGAAPASTQVREDIVRAASTIGTRSPQAP